MDADRWARLNEIFHAALALAPGHRAAWLASACGSDDALRREADELLQAHERAELDPVALDRVGLPVSFDTLTGRRIGAYRILNEIGRGGMGAVLLAERADGSFDQRVAIKLIRPGMDTAQILARFRTERQILARLEHPNIARLIDGGTTGEGTPYFVMEYIEGQPIDEYVGSRQLPLATRLELFLQVCDAVSYAHRHLIVHRDIKPQNILVTGGGVPKLLDFGIAKMLQGAGEPGTLTIGGLQLLTPDYASPEQVDGRETTTQTDVYSLGVVLYELLTGRSPYRPRTWSPPDVCESVRAADIDRPSSAVLKMQPPSRPGRPGPGSAAAPPARLRLQLRGDLDAIVLTALRREPERRYASVEQLAGDLRRHLQGQPVLARPDGLGYRAAKFVRRNRVAVTAAAVVALTLVGGIVATAWQARHARAQARLAREAQAQAERRFAEVRALANAVIFDYHDAIKGLPGATPVRARLVQDALEYLNGLAAEGGADRSLRREIALAYRRVADVQGGPTGGSLGDTTGAIESQRKSLTMLEALLAEQPGDATARSDVADGALRLAALLALTPAQSDALAHARRARSLYEPLASAETLTRDQRLALAHAYDVAGTLSLESGRPSESLETHERQRRLLESAPAGDREHPSLRRALATAYHHLADAQSTFGDTGAALESLRHALRLRLGLAAEFPQDLEYRQLVATTRYWEADALARLDRPVEALAVFRSSLAIVEELVAADPQGHSRGFVVVRIGDMLARLGDHAQAVTHFRRARAEFAAEARRDPGDLWKRAGLIDVSSALCASLAALAQHTVVSTICRDTARLIEETTVEPTNAVVRAALARSYRAMAAGLTGLAAHPSSSVDQRRAYTRTAQDMLRRSIAIWEDMSARGMLTASDDREAAAVKRSLTEAEEGLRRLDRPGHASAGP